jgi:hypothetical protein
VIHEQSNSVSAYPISSSSTSLSEKYGEQPDGSVAASMMWGTTDLADCSPDISQRESWEELESGFVQME